MCVDGRIPYIVLLAWQMAAVEGQRYVRASAGDGLANRLKVGASSRHLVNGHPSPDCSCRQVQNVWLQIFGLYGIMNDTDRR